MNSKCIERLIESARVLSTNLNRTSDLVILLGDKEYKILVEGEDRSLLIGSVGANITYDGCFVKKIGDRGITVIPSGTYNLLLDIHKEDLITTLTRSRTLLRNN